MKKLFSLMSSVLLCFLFSLLFCATFCLEVKAEEPPQFAWMSPQPKWHFNSPRGIAIDGSGNVFVADTYNNRIQKLNSNGMLLAKWGSSGSGVGQFSYPLGIAIDGSGNVYVADSFNYRIQKFSLDGTFLAKWGSRGSGEGQFSVPWGIAIDGSGNVYVADRDNDRIQKFSSNGTFLTKWGSYGTGDGQFNSPSGIAIDSSGNVYVADRDNRRIQKFSSNGTFLTKWGSSGSGAGQFRYPEGIAIDGSGNVYVVDDYYDRIQKFSSSGTFLAKWGSGGMGDGDGRFSELRGIAIDGSGNVYVADTGCSSIQKFSSNGTFLAKWGNSGSGDGQFNSPEGIAIDGSGNVYVADNDNHRIQKFSTNGTFLAKWGSFGAGDGQFGCPDGIAIDGAGNVYVTDVWNARIQKFNSNGTFLTKWGSGGSGDGQFNDPRGIAIDGGGNVYVADRNGNRIQKFTSNGTFLTKWGSGGSGDGQFSYPTGIAIDASGNVYVADGTNHRIQKFSSNGTFLTKWGSRGSGDGQFESPWGIAIDGSGNVYVVGPYNNRIQKFSSDGTWLAKWGSYGVGDGQFKYPTRIAIDGSGNVYVADNDNYRIQKFTYVRPVTTLHICGYVRNDTTKQPIPNAQISIGGTTGFTNQKGYYWISNIEEGIFTVIATIKGYKTSKQFNIDVVENMVTSEVNFLMESGLGGEEDFQGTYCQVYLKDSKPDETFIVKIGDPGAGNLGVYTAGKIEFEIYIDRYYGELQDPNDPNMAYLKYPDMLKNKKIISAHLELMMYDIDSEEFNTVEVNGHMNVARVKEDMNNSWTQITVDIPIDVIKFPKMGSESIPPSPRKNKIVIHIDEEKGYKTRCDWAALTIKGVRPIVFIHGKGSNSMEWSFGGEYGRGDGENVGWHNFRGNFIDVGLITDVVDYWPEDNPELAVLLEEKKFTCEDWIDNDGDGDADYFNFCPPLHVGLTCWESICKENQSQGIPESGLKIKEATNEYTIWHSIAEQMAQIKNKYGVEKVNIVAHSMGGLAARRYAEFASVNKSRYPIVKDLFMLGTPNHGSPLATYSSISGIRKTPSVDWLTESYMKNFNEKFKEVSGVKYYTIAGNGGKEDKDIPNPFHWFGDPSSYNYSMGYKAGYWGWWFMCEENDNLVPVHSAHFVATPDFPDSFTTPLGTYPLNHHTIRDNADVAKCILSVILNNDEPCCPYCEETLSRHRLYKDATSSADSTPFTGAMNTQNSSIAPGETKIHTCTLNQCEEVFFSLSWLDTAQDIILSVIDPNNHTITEADPTITFAHEPGLSFYSIPDPNSGTWQLFIDGNNLAYPIAYSLTTIITGNGLSHSLTSDKDFYYQNEPVLITQTLQEWDAPILDANITVTIIDPNHNEMTITLPDDGTQGDIVANDGVYSNTINSLTIGGHYSITSISQGSFTDGIEFSNTDYISFSVAKADASLGDVFTESLEDIEGDDLYDKLIIRTPLEVATENSYLLVGDLHSEDGQKITWSKTSALLSAGQQTIDLAFDGKEIFTSGLDGPYFLKNLTLWLEEGDYKLDELQNAYVTTAYSHRQFQRDKISIVTDGLADRGIDVNGNGKFDFLELSFCLDIVDEADYTIDADLMAEDSRPVACMTRTYHLYPGINTVSIPFLGPQIYERGLDGPYLLKNVTVSSSTDSISHHEIIDQTDSAYLFTDFDKPAPKAPAGVLISPMVKGLQVSWDESEDNPAGYKVYYGFEKGDYEFSVDANNSLSYQLTELEGGERYFVALTAYDNQKTESGFSQEVEAAPQILEGDTDGDGLPDTWENTYETMDMYDPNDAIQDYDQDKLDNSNEYQQNTDPGNPDSDNPQTTQ